MTRVLIVDDHELFRAGVRVELEPHVEIAGEASTVDEALALIAELDPDVVLLDVHFPDGGGVEDVLGVIGLWWVGAVAVLGRARGATPWDPLLRAAHRAPFFWACAGALVLIALLDFTSLGSISAVPVALGAVAVPALLAGALATRAYMTA